MSELYDEDNDFEADSYDESGVASSSLSAEYDATFTGEEKASNLLKITSEAFIRRTDKIKISQIGISEPLKVGRMNTTIGLTSSVKELGVVTPIHVMTMEDEDDDFKYMLVDGLRRMFAARKNGQEYIDAVIWDFHDKERGMDIALSLSLILNRTQTRSWGEKWELYKILELQSEITPGTLEYLLQLESGDAMKLKDVMLCPYEEVINALLNNEKDLDGCYKMLQKLRKEEDKLAMEDARGVTDTIEDSDDIAGNNLEAEDGQLSDDDVYKLLEMVNDSDIDDVTDDDFDDLNTSAFGAETQKVGERHPVDPAIRQGTFQRDKFKCRCCGTGGVAFLATLIYHHAIPVHCGGQDTVENGLTLCDSCHQTLHCAEKAGGKIPMTEAQFKEYSEEEQERIKRILKFAKIAVKAAQMRGVSKDKIIEEANRSARHRMPGENLKETQRSFVNSGSPSVNNSDEDEE